jgi:lysozyme
MTVICVDLSKYQEGFSFSTFKQSGGLGVILKASEGETDADPCYADFRTQALAAGLTVASYHFLRPGDMTAQADFYLGAAAPGEGERVVCDWEDAGCDVQAVVEFMQRIAQKRPDLQLTVYGSSCVEENVGANAWLGANTSLWTAQYGSSPSPWATSTWPQWSLWQYTDQHPVPGFSGAVDQSRFNGSDANFLKWMGPAVAPPAPAPQPGAASVQLTVEADQPVNLTITAGNNVTIQ